MGVKNVTAGRSHHSRTLEKNGPAPSSRRSKWQWMDQISLVRTHAPRLLSSLCPTAVVFQQRLGRMEVSGFPQKKTSTLMTPSSASRGTRKKGRRPTCASSECEKTPCFGWPSSSVAGRKAKPVFCVTHKEPGAWVSRWM